MDLESPSCIQACGVNGCGEDDGWGINICPGCSKDAAGQWDSYINMADKMIAFEKKKEEKQMVWDAGIPEATLEAAHPQFAVLTQEEKRKEENDKLIQMSYKTAFAIALHNFPEGLATFVAALSDPKVGAVLAVAIAIHNIPEGVCVALPLYYATANKTKAFWWGVLSGLSEPLAALLGWAILANSFSDALFGILFGIVSGMMVLISVRELLPTAHRYDPEDTVVTFAFTGGMAVMGLSLGVFLL